MHCRHRWTQIYTDKKCKFKGEFNKGFDSCILNYLCKSVSICGDNALVFRSITCQKLRSRYRLARVGIRDVVDFTPAMSVLSSTHGTRDDVASTLSPGGVDVHEPKGTSALNKWIRRLCGLVITAAIFVWICKPIVRNWDHFKSHVYEMSWGRLFLASLMFALFLFVFRARLAATS